MCRLYFRFFHLLPMNLDEWHMQKTHLEAEALPCYTAVAICTQATSKERKLAMQLS